MNKDTFGINIKQWCREHEKMVSSAVPSEELLREHEKKIVWLQHERLVHLIVTFMVVLVELFSVYVTLVYPEFGVLPAIITAVLAILLGFYFWHYFFLENTVQRWYKLAEEMTEELETSPKRRK